MTESALSCCVLGAVRVLAGDTPVRIAAPRQRALLALLLLDVNRTVSSSSLIDGIWGDTPPQHPDSALHIVVCRLRQALDPVASMLVSDPGGYRITLEPGELDLTRGEAHAAAARRALDEQDARRAASELDAAVVCWSGKPLADVASFPFHERAARRLRELQLAMVESRNVAYLLCGRHLEILSDIESWISENPWRERLRAHQMVALYRGGRQIEALAAYEELRRLLVTDFGIDPHVDLQRLQHRILRRDPTLLGDRNPGLPVDVSLIDHDEQYARTVRLIK